MDLVVGFKELLQWTKQRKYDAKIGGNSKKKIGCLQLGFKGGTVIGNSKARVGKRDVWEKQGFGLIFDLKITKNGERSSSRKKTGSQTLKSSMEKRQSTDDYKNQWVKFNLVRCMSKELEILGKNSGPEGARSRKRIT